MHHLCNYTLQLRAVVLHPRVQLPDRRPGYDVLPQHGKLPVRLEFVIPRGEDESPVVSVEDRFEWNVDLPADVFEPVIPAGFAERMGG